MSISANNKFLFSGFFAALATTALLLVLFFKYNIVWKDLSPNALWYFTRIGFGSAGTFTLVAVVLFFIGFKNLRKERKQQQLVTGARL